MTAILGTLMGLGLAGVVLVIVKTTGQSHLARQLATVAGAVCLVLFVMINVSDWPGGFLNQFWLDHAIVGATAGSVLLAATVFLIYRYRDQQQQDLVDESIVDAGRTELVDRLLEVDVALSLLCAPTQPDLCRTHRWQKTPRGLEWLREHLDEASVDADGSWAERDPRRQVHATHVHAEGWRLPLLDEMVGRVADGIREWGPILMRSRAGQRDLVAFANVRVVLLHLDRQLRKFPPMDTSAARDLQRVVQRFARLLVVDEQTPEPRTRLLVPEFEAALSFRAATTADEAVLPLLERIEDHIQSRVRLQKHRDRMKARGVLKARKPDESEQSVASLDAASR